MVDNQALLNYTISNLNPTDIQVNNITFIDHAEHPFCSDSIFKCIFLSIIFGLIIIFTIIGNAFVIAAVWLERNLHHEANYLIVSLAFADLMVAIMVMPIGAYQEVSHYWLLGKALCVIWTSVDVLCCTASILHLVAIALDRYWAITNLDYAAKRTGKRINSMIILIWTVSTITALTPHIFGLSFDGYNQYRCQITDNLTYQLFSTLAAFYLPLIIMCIIYWKIFQSAKFRIRKKGFHHSKQSSVTNSKTTSSKAKCNTNHALKMIDKQSQTERIEKETNLKQNPNELLTSNESKQEKKLSLATLNQLEHQTNSSNQPVCAIVTHKEEVVGKIEMETSQNKNSDKTEHYANSDDLNKSRKDENYLQQFELNADAKKKGKTRNGFPKRYNSLQPEYTCFEANSKRKQYKPMLKKHISHDLTSLILKDETTTPKQMSNYKIFDAQRHALKESDSDIYDDDFIMCDLVEFSSNFYIPLAHAESGFHSNSLCSIETANNPNTVLNSTYTPTSQATNNTEKAKENKTSETIFSSNTLQCSANLSVVNQIETKCNQINNCANNGDQVANKTTESLNTKVDNLSTQTTTNKPINSQNANANQIQHSSSANLAHSTTNVNVMIKKRAKIDMKRERKAAKTLGVIMSCFILCWLPFFLMQIVSSVCKDCQLIKFFENGPLFTILTWLGYLNSLLNPIIYTIFSPDFRCAFAKILFGKYRNKNRRGNFHLVNLRKKQLVK